jgi:hypothetical protein
MDNIFDDKGFNFKEKVEEADKKGEIKLSDIEVNKLNNKNLKFITKREKYQKIIEFARTETEVELMKNLLKVIKPHLDDQDESTKKSYEYFRMKVWG